MTPPTASTAPNTASRVSVGPGRSWLSQTATSASTSARPLTNRPVGTGSPGTKTFEVRMYQNTGSMPTRGSVFRDHPIFHPRVGLSASSARAASAEWRKRDRDRDSESAVTVRPTPRPAARQPACARESLRPSSLAAAARSPRHGPQPRRRTPRPVPVSRCRRLSARAAPTPRPAMRGGVPASVRNQTSLGLRAETEQRPSDVLARRRRTFTTGCCRRVTAMRPRRPGRSRGRSLSHSARGRPGACLRSPRNPRRTRLRWAGSRPAA